MAITDREYMKLAVEQAKQAKKESEWPFGAVIVCDNQVIAQNRVSEKMDRNVLSHAELKTVGDACKALGRNNLSDCVIYCSNEPCLMCAAAIFQAKIPKVVIGASRSDLPRLLRKRRLDIKNIAEDSGYHIEIVHGICREDVLKLFEDIKKDEHLEKIVMGIYTFFLMPVISLRKPIFLLP